MSEHRCTIAWKRATEGFGWDEYDRTHTWTFGGERTPDAAELERMHHQAHEACFIANSVRTEVAVEPR